MYSSRHCSDINKVITRINTSITTRTSNNFSNQQNGGKSFLKQIFNLKLYPRVLTEHFFNIRVQWTEQASGQSDCCTAWVQKASVYRSDMLANFLGRNIQARSLALRFHFQQSRILHQSWRRFTSDKTQPSKVALTSDFNTRKVSVHLFENK